MVLSRLRIAVGLLTIVPALSGCIAWEIHDEVRTANQRIDEVDGMLIGTADRLDSTNERINRTIELLESTHASIQQTNSQLAEVQTLLKQTDEHMVGVTGVIEATNPVLTTANAGLDRLQILNEIQKSLDDISAALVPLQKTMSSLNGAMSFLGMEGEEAPVADATEEPAPGQDEKPASGASDLSTGDARRLLGTWILAHPLKIPGKAAGPADVLILLGDGRYLDGDNGKVRGAGKWSRSGATLTLTPQGNAAGGTLEIVTLSARSLTVRAGDDMRIYARP